MSCFDSTHAPVATAARAAGTGLVSMSTRPDIPGMLHREREARDWSTYNEYSYRIILLLLLYVFVVAHIPISLLNFGGVACRIFFTSSANSPKSWWEGKLVFMWKASTFLKTYFRKHSNISFFHVPWSLLTMRWKIAHYRFPTQTSGLRLRQCPAAPWSTIRAAY